MPQLFGNKVSLEELKRPEINDALFFQLQLQTSPCCVGRCCVFGKSIPCIAIHPHADGIILELQNNTFLLNNSKIIKRVAKGRRLKVKNRTVLGWTLPCRVSEAIRHPWGAIVIEGTINLDPGTGFLVHMLVLPRHST